MKRTKKLFVLILFSAAATLLLTRCSKIEDTIAKFQDGINTADYMKIASTLSAECEDYDALKNNNWSGLKSAVILWNSSWSPLDFTGLDIDENSDSATVDCTMAADTGDFPARFAMVKKTDFLSETWKIKKWWVDADGDGIGVSAFSNVLIQRLPAR